MTRKLNSSQDIITIRKIKYIVKVIALKDTGPLDPQLRLCYYHTTPIR